MKSRKKLLQSSRLYVILDKYTYGKKSVKDLAARIRGADIVQLRDKISRREAILENARLLQKALLNTKTLFIVNDYLDVAKIVDCDGIHLGQFDTPIQIARKVLGKDKIIGLSCHNLKQALEAQKSGADYIGFGPIFPTPTKPQYKAIGPDSIKKLKKKIKIPLFVIGNINQDNISEVKAAGAARVAVCRAVLKAKNIPDSIRKLNLNLKPKT